MSCGGRVPLLPIKRVGGYSQGIGSKSQDVIHRVGVMGLVRSLERPLFRIFSKGTRMIYAVIIEKEDGKPTWRPSATARSIRISERCRPGATALFMAMRRRLTIRSCGKPSSDCMRCRRRSWRCSICAAPAIWARRPSGESVREKVVGHKTRRQLCVACATISA